MEKIVIEIIMNSDEQPKEKMTSDNYIIRSDSIVEPLVIKAMNTMKF